jgi:hypothetical protein
MSSNLIIGAKDVPLPTLEKWRKNFEREERRRTKRSLASRIQRYIAKAGCLGSPVVDDNGPLVVLPPVSPHLTLPTLTELS